MKLRDPKLLQFKVHQVVIPSLSSTVCAQKKVIDLPDQIETTWVRSNVPHGFLSFLLSSFSFFLFHFFSFALCFSFIFLLFHLYFSVSCSLVFLFLPYCSPVLSPPFYSLIPCLTLPCPPSLVFLTLFLSHALSSFSFLYSPSFPFLSLHSFTSKESHSFLFLFFLTEEKEKN